MLKRILLSIVTILLLLYLAETYFRKNGRYASYNEMNGTGGYVSPYTPWLHSWYYRHYPDSIFYQKKDEFTVRWKANNEGFKDTTFITTKDKIRIITLGDSFTEGQGADNDSSLPRNLSYILRDSMSDRSQVWNAGLSGSDPVFEYKIYHDRLLKYQPDMVIVVINSSDISDVVIRGGFERFASDSTLHYKRGPWFEGAYAQSYIVRRVVHDIFHYTWQFIPPGAQKESHESAIHVLTDAIDSFARSTADRHIKLLFVFHPSRPEYAHYVPYEVEPLISYCQQKQLPYIDVGSQWRSMHLSPSDSVALYWNQDGHCTNMGYRYMVKAIWRKVYDILQGT